MSAVLQPLLPGATLGVIGGGQLGRMVFVHRQAGHALEAAGDDRGRVDHAPGAATVNGAELASRDHAQARRHRVVGGALEREKKLKEQKERELEQERQEKLKQQQAAKKAQEKKELEI